MCIKDDGLKKISQIKVLMLICVVWGHACVVYASADGTWGGITSASGSLLWGYINKFFSLFHTQTFTMASGYLFYFNRYETNKYRTPKYDLLHRLDRLIKPYIIISLLWAIPWEIWALNLNVKEIILNFILAENPAQLWFLIMLFGVFIIFYLISDIFMKLPVPIGILILLVISYLASLTGKILPLHIFQLDRILKYLLFFYLGCVIRKNKVLERKKVHPVYYFIGYLGLFLFYCYCLNRNGVIGYVTTIITPLCGIVGILMICSFASYIPDKHIINRVFNLLGSNAMGIYLLHQQITYVLFRIFNNIFFVPTLVVISTFGATMMISYTLVTLLRKWNICQKLLI